MKGDWIEIEFGDLLNYLQPTSYIVNNTNYDDSYKTPVLTPGKSFIKGYTNETEGIFNDLPVIIFDDFTTASRYVNFPFKVKSSAMKILIPTSAFVNLKFVFYGMQVNRIRSDTHKRYWISVYSKKSLLLPPLPEQRAIVAKIEQLFSELDNGIANLQAAKDKLAIYRQAVLKKAFEGELTQAWRAQQTNLPTADQLLEQIKAEREAHYQQQLRTWQQSVIEWDAQGRKGKKPGKPKKGEEVEPISEEYLEKLPDIVSSWQWSNLMNIAELIGGVTKGRKLEGRALISLPYLRVANVQDGYLDLNQIKEIAVLPDDLKKYKLHKGDILYTEGGDKDKLGRGTIWNDEIKDCIHQNHIFRARLYLKGMSSKFVGYYSQTRTAKNYFFSKAKQTTNLASINLTVLSDLPIPICSIPEQTQIVQEIESRLSVCDKLGESIDDSLQKAEALRQSILKRAFAGRLLTEAELTTCRQEPDWEPAEKLLQRIKGEKAAPVDAAPVDTAPVDTAPVDTVPTTGNLFEQ
ncbi:MAG: restriction endonuclease subunit S [Tunicatimonas sp.]